MKTIQRLLVLSLVAAAAYLGWQWWLSQQAEPLPDGIVFGNGRVEAVQVDIATKYAGRIKEILVSEGDLVEQGQVLAKMDTDELEASLAQAQARIAEAEESVHQSEALLVERESEFQLASQQFDRATQLYEKKVTTRDEYDQQKSRRDVAKAAIEAARANVNTMRRSVDAAKAGTKQIEVQISDAVLTSPVQGRVLYQLAENGEVLSGGGKVLTLLDLSDIYMEIFLPSRDVARIAIGAEARIVLDVAPGYAGAAKVSFVSPEAQFTPKQVETADERDKLMFRVKVQVPEEAVRRHIDKIKTGIRGGAYVRLDDSVLWPAKLERRFPDNLSEIHAKE